MKIFESEWNVLNVIWSHERIKASEIAVILNNEIGWNRNTTYTIIKRCLEKKLIEREDPGFWCKALIGKDEVLEKEADDLIATRYDGSLSNFIAAFLKCNKLSKEEGEEILNILKGDDDICI